MKTQLLNLLTEEVTNPTSKGETAKNIVDFFQSDPVKATGYILITIAVVVVAVALFIKAWKKR